MKYLFKKKINIHCLRANGPVYLFIILLSFLFLACPEDSPPPRDTTINLGVLSVFATTARLHISVEDTTAEWTFGLTRNGEEVLTATVYNRDTTLIDGGLTSGTQYTYQAHWLEDGAAVDSSVKVTARTTDTKIHLEVLSTFTTTARLHISVEDTTAEWTLGLIRNGEDVLTATVYGNDTTFIDDGLTPSTQYTYQAQRLYDSIAVDMSLTAIAQTMDITSHNFVWEIDTLGIYPSYLNDVAIVDENNIWVVGYIRTDEPDTIHNLPYSSYNAAHWDGEEWELHRIAPEGFFGPVTAVFAFSDTDVWFGKYGLPIHFDGELFTKYSPSNGGHPGQPSINAIWGTSSSDLYFVGGSGSIVHYDGSTFTKMESGTEVSIIDIGGLDEDHIWAVTHRNDGTGIVNEVLFYDGNEWSIKFERITDNWPPQDYTRPSGRFRSVWAYGDTVYISCASLYKESISTGAGVLVPLEDMHWQLGWGTRNVRGTGSNDIVVTTALGSKVSHYNGKDWEFYDELDMVDVHGSVVTAGVSITRNMMVIAGKDLNTSKAVVYRGYRY